MIDRCANPACSKPLIYLRSGALYAVEAPVLAKASAVTRFFWLCESCSREFTLHVEGAGEPTVERSRYPPNLERSLFQTRIRRVAFGRPNEQPPAVLPFVPPTKVAPPKVAPARTAPPKEDRSVAFATRQLIGA